MKHHTKQEARNALQKLPQPLLGFVDSVTLSNLYEGIRKKHNFTLGEIISIATATNFSLIGLEPESALETNIHQLLPTLSNTVTRELVADINDRIFKEAHRRVSENVIEHNPMTLDPELPPLTEEEKKREAELERVEILDDDSPELAALRDAENKALEERRAKERAEDEKLAAQEPKETGNPQLDPEEEVRQALEWLQKNPDTPIEQAPFYKKAELTPEEELAAEEKLAQEKSAPAPSVKIAQATAINTVVKDLEARVVERPRGNTIQSVVRTKLNSLTVGGPAEISAPKPLSETPIIAPPESVSSARTEPQKSRRVDGIDPYREIPD